MGLFDKNPSPTGGLFAGPDGTPAPQAAAPAAAGVDASKLFNVGGAVASEQAAPKPQKGGGIWGFAKNAIKDSAQLTNPANIAKGLAGLYGDAAVLGARTGETVLNSGANLEDRGLRGLGLGSGPLAGTQEGAHWGGGQSTVDPSADNNPFGNWNQFKAMYPTLGGAISSVGKTATHAQGITEALAHPVLSAPLTELQMVEGGGSKPVQTPMGAAHKTWQDFLAHPVAMPVNDAANLSMLLGGTGTALGAVGGALGAGDAAAMGGTEGALTAGEAGAAAAPEAAVAAPTVASRLAGAADVANTLSELTGKAGFLPQHAMLAPLHGIDLPGLGTHIPGLADTAVGGKIADSVHATVARTAMAKDLLERKVAARLGPYEQLKQAGASLGKLDKFMPEDHIQAGLLRASQDPAVLRGLEAAAQSDPALLQALGTAEAAPVPSAAHLAASPPETVLHAEQVFRDLSAAREKWNLEHGNIQPESTVAAELPQNQWERSLQQELAKKQATAVRQGKEADAAQARADTAAGRIRPPADIAQGNSGISRAHVLSEQAKRGLAAADAADNLRQGAEMQIAGKGHEEVIRNAGANVKDIQAKLEADKAAIVQQHAEALAAHEARPDIQALQQANDAAIKALVDARHGDMPVPAGMSREGLIEAAGARFDQTARQLAEARAEATAGLPPIPTAHPVAEARRIALANEPSTDRVFAAREGRVGTADAKVRDALATDAEARAAGLRKTAPDAFNPGSFIDKGEHTPGFDSLTPQEKVMYREEEARQRAELGVSRSAAQDAKTLGTMAERGRTTGVKEGIKVGKADVHQQIADRAAARYQRSLDAVHEVLTREDTGKLPAPLRSRVTSAHLVLNSLREQIANDPTAAAELSKIADEVEKATHLEHYQTTPGSMTHIIGDNRNDANRYAREQQPGTGRPGREASTKAGHFRTGVSTTFSVKGQLTNESEFWNKEAHNEMIGGIKKDYARPVGELVPNLGDLSSKELRAALIENGYKAWDPKPALSTGLEPAPESVHADTLALPIAVHDALSRTMRAVEKPEGVGEQVIQSAGRNFRRATTLAYRSTLNLSPHFLLLRSVGDAFVSKIQGDMSWPVLINRLNQAYELHKGREVTLDNGMTFDHTPAVLDRNALAAVDEQTGTGKNPVDKLNRQLTRPSQRIDQMARVAVMLNETEKTGSQEAGVMAGAHVLGDLSSIGKSEQALSGVVPIYPWIKAVAKAAAKLQEDSPAKALFYVHLGNLAATDPNIQKMLKDPGAIRGIAGEASPIGFADGGLGSFGNYINPLAKLPAKELLGVNPDKHFKQLSNPSGSSGGLLGNISGTGGFDNPGQAAYVAANSLPLGKLILQSRPLSGLDQGVSRYDTGDIHLDTKTGRPLPNIMPSYLGGKAGYYLPQFAGIPQEPHPTAGGALVQAKIQAKAAKTASHRSAQIKALNAQGVR